MILNNKLKENIKFIFQSILAVELIVIMTLLFGWGSAIIINITTKSGFFEVLSFSYIFAGIGFFVAERIYVSINKLISKKTKKKNGKK